MRSPTPWICASLALWAGATLFAQDVSVPAGTTQSYTAPLTQLTSLTTTTATVAISGRVELTGNFVLGGNIPGTSTNNAPTLSTFEITVGPARDGQAVLLVAGGTLQIGGQLRVRAADGYMPPPDTVIPILRGASRTGTFATIDEQADLGALIEYTADGVNLRTTKPRGTTAVIIDEDWTDGSVDSTGWNDQSGVGDGFPRATNHRAGIGIPFAVVRPATRGQWNTLVKFPPSYRAGPEDVTVLRLTSFSDVAYAGMENAKPEIALLRVNNAHFWGHDNSAELSNHYSTRSFDHQMRPSLGNDDGKQISNAHVSGARNETNLAQADTGLAIFRPGAGQAVEAEGHGRNAWGVQNFNGPLGPWNEVLISLPNSHNANNDIYVTGASEATAQVGMSHAFAGITHRTDANLDWVTDASDFIYWLANRNQTGTNLQRGDFDNDGQTNDADLPLWQAAAGRVHEANWPKRRSLRFGVGAPEPTATTVTAAFRYNAGTGRFEIQSSSAPIVAWQVTMPTPRFLPTLNSAGGRIWWQGRVVGKENWVDSARVGQGPGLLATLPEGLGASDFSTVTYADANGGVGTVAVTIVAAAPVTLSTWASAWGMTGNDALATGNVAGDGLPNILKYALGLNPRQRETMPTGRPTMAMVEGTPTLVLRLTRPSNRSGATLVAEVADSPAPGATWTVVTPTVTAGANNTEEVSVALPLDGSAPGARFVRWRARTNP